MQTASEIIDRFGGPASLSKETGFPLTTIIGWRDANFIPEWRRPTLIKLAKRVSPEKPLKDKDFPPIEQRRPRRPSTKEGNA